MYDYNAKILNVVDGDTFDLDVDLGFNIHNYIRVRLLDIDTPEKRGNVEKLAGLACTKFAKQFEGEEVTIISHKGTDSFGRWLVNLRFKRTGEDIIDLYNDMCINKKSIEYSENMALQCGDMVWPNEDDLK